MDGGSEIRGTIKGEANKVLRIMILTSALLAVASAPASAQGKFVFGQGINSCGSWTQARQTKSVSAGLSMQWVAGYLSGRNAQSSGIDFLGTTDFDGLMAWIDNYCRQNPLEKIGTAAYQLMIELQFRALQS
jgi:hypothetical protein